MRKSKYSEDAIREALISTCGNVTHAAAVLETSKVHVMRLTAKYALREFACRLRLLAGQAATGRPAMVSSLN